MRKVRNLIFASTAFAFALALAGYFFAVRKPSLPDFLANRSDGYEQIVALGKTVDRDPKLVTNAVEFIASNPKVFQEFARVAQLHFEPPERQYEQYRMENDILPLSRLSRAWLIREQQLEKERQFAAAADACVTNLIYCLNIERGPLINLLIGIALEQPTVHYLNQLIPKLSTNDLARLVPRLRKLNRSRIDFEEVARRERYFGKMNSDGVVDDIKEWWSGQLQSQFDSAKERLKVAEAQVEILAATLAASEYRIARGHAPTSLRDLVPSILDSESIDPFSSQPLHFLLNGTNIVIYSVGPNGKDEKGKTGDIVVLGYIAPPTKASVTEPALKRIFSRSP